MTFFPIVIVTMFTLASMGYAIDEQWIKSAFYFLSAMLNLVVIYMK